jgi:hypothetical protein
LQAYYVYDTLLLSKDSADEFKHKMRNHTSLLASKIDELETRFYENSVRGICANQVARLLFTLLTLKK